MFKLGADVYCLDSKVGTLVKLVVDPHTRRISDLVIERGLVRKKDRVVPVELVESVSDDRIQFTITSNELANYPEYKELEFTSSDPALLREMGYGADVDIQAEVQDRFRASSGFDLSHIRVILTDGLVRLIGPVRSILAKDRAAEIARDVEGVLGLENELILDREVETQVINALLKDPCCGQMSIEVRCENGVVTLSGHVPSAADRAAAGEITSSQKGVLKVNNELQIAQLSETER